VQHYGELAGTYRKLDRLGAEGRSDRARAMSYGDFTPTERIRYAGQLQKFGGYEGLETMGKMRYGGFEPDVMMPYFEQATRAGAAGGLKKADYDYLAKVIAVGFSKQGLPSVEQAIETLSGLMGTASNYLADIDKDQTAELAAMTHWMEGSNTAVLRGPRGVQTMATLTNWTAKTGDPAKEMFIWQALAKGRPGMSYGEMRKYRETTGATMAMVKEFAGLPREYGEMALAETTGMSYRHAEAVLKAYDKFGDSDHVRDLIKNANPADIDFKAEKGKKYDEVTAGMTEIAEKQLKISEEYMTKFLDMEKLLIEKIGDLARDFSIKEQIEALTRAIKWLADDSVQRAAKDQQRKDWTEFKWSEVEWNKLPEKVRQAFSGLDKTPE
jgi:hypothetical protein